MSPRNKLVAVVKTFPQTGARLVRVAYVWPCFNCHSVLEVDRYTFTLLERKQLVGLKCGKCLTPTPTHGVLKVA